MDVFGWVFILKTQTGADGRNPVLALSPATNSVIMGCAVQMVVVPVACRMLMEIRIPGHASLVKMKDVIARPHSEMFQPDIQIFNYHQENVFICNANHQNAHTPFAKSNIYKI